MRDVIVAGGGPVGLAVALHAVRAGLDVIVCEPREGPVDKACGEGLMPGAVAALADLGVDPPGQPLAGIRYVDRGRSVEAPFRQRAGRGVRRTTLHGALLDAAAAQGVRIERRAVRAIGQDADGVTVDGERARYLVAADGLHSRIRRTLRLDGGRRGLRRYGLRCHVRTLPWTSYVEVHWSRHAEAYVTPVEPDLVGVAVLTRSRVPIAQHLASFPSLAARLEGRELTAVRGAGPLHQTARRRVAGRVVLVGDAAGYVDALTGEGIALGLAQARAAVAAIAREAPEEYEREWRAITRSHRLLTRSLLYASQVPPLRRSLVPAACRLPSVFTAAVDVLAGPA